MLALGGDLGCSAGPTLVGMVSSAWGDSLDAGILSAVVFPAAMLAVYALLVRVPREGGEQNP